MTKEDPLARKLARLTAKDTFTGQQLDLGPSGTPEAMDHILQVIDDTMLLRHVTFAVGSSTVTLRISGKRVLCLAAASDDMRLPDGLIDLPLTSSTSDALGQVAMLLQSLIEKAGTLTLERIPAKGVEGQTGSGVGVQMLQTRWTEVRDTPKLPTAARFRAMCKPVASAIIMLSDGEVETVWGAQSEVDHLERIFASVWSDFDRDHQSFVASESGPLLRILTGVGSEEQTLVLAITEENQCLVLSDVKNVPELAAAWARALSAI